jgi:hypothetical protein
MNHLLVVTCFTFSFAVVSNSQVSNDDTALKLENRFSKLKEFYAGKWYQWQHIEKDHNDDNALGRDPIVWTGVTTAQNSMAMIGTCTQNGEIYAMGIFGLNKDKGMIYYDVYKDRMPEGLTRSFHYTLDVDASTDTLYVWRTTKGHTGRHVVTKVNGNEVVLWQIKMDNAGSKWENISWPLRRDEPPR